MYEALICILIFSILVIPVELLSILHGKIQYHIRADEHSPAASGRGISFSGTASVFELRDDLDHELDPIGRSQNPFAPQLQFPHIIGSSQNRCWTKVH
jgi:hypothetical protein